MFIRFVVGVDDEHHRSLTGVITEARLLRDRDKLLEHELKWLEEIYEWLNAHLPCPPFSKSDWSRDAVSWFKDDAGGWQTAWPAFSLPVEGVTAVLRDS